MTGENTYSRPGTRILDQPSIEAILDEVRGLSDSLRGVNGVILLSILKQAEVPRSNFATAVKRLGATADRDRIRNGIHLIHSQHPYLLGYLQNHGHTAGSEVLVPLYDDYVASGEGVLWQVDRTYPDDGSKRPRLIG